MKERKKKKMSPRMKCLESNITAEKKKMGNAESGTHNGKQVESSRHMCREVGLILVI